MIMLFCDLFEWQENVNLYSVSLTTLNLHFFLFDCSVGTPGSGEVAAEAQCLS
jgi:hypothetical protein